MIEEQWGHTLQDPRRYSPEVILEFWHWHHRQQQRQEQKELEQGEEATTAGAAAPSTDPGAAITASGGMGNPNPIRRLLLLGVHSHHQYRGSVASVAAVRAAFGNPPTALVALPCCHEFHPAADVGRPPDHEHDDEAIFSEKRRVLVWRWPSGAAPLCNKSKIGSK